MGGRGSWSGTGQSTGGGKGGNSGGGGRKYKDVTKQFQGMKLHEFENAIRDRKTEYAGVFDEKGNLVIAVTSGSSGSTGIPTAESTNAAILTHNHPYQGSRTIGATFSEADIMVQTSLNIGQVRAVTNGPNEHTYIMKKGSNANSNKLYASASASRSKNLMGDIGTKALNKVTTKMANKGYSSQQISARRGQIYLGSMKNYWKSVTQGTGYEYIEVKKAHW